jgi:primosomal protein N' (replication factor Y)
VRVVAGTRAAAFAPVHDLGLVALWDDGDDLYAEPRAPYPHTREVLLMRAHDTGCAAVLGGVARSVESAALVSRGWARDVAADRDTVRRHAPLVTVTGATDLELARDPMSRVARVPREAHAVLREALQSGPVLVQTPRAGYAVSLVCDRCRAPRRCDRCSGPLHLPAPDCPPTCRWCGVESQERGCPSCGSRGLRVPVVGERRTAEELGRAFPRVPVRRSSGDRVLDTVPERPAIVVATPGAEPVAEGGYAAVLLLDTWLVLARPDLRAAEEAVRRWFNAAALARPASAGGRVVAVGDPREPTLQALVRWDPAGIAEREAADRASAHLPPASRLAVLSGPPDAVESLLAGLAQPPGAEVLGPVPATSAPGAADAARSEDSEQVRVVVRVPRRHGAELTRSLRAAQGVRAARKLPHVRVQVDPHALG